MTRWNRKGKQPSEIVKWGSYYPVQRGLRLVWIRNQVAASIASMTLYDLSNIPSVWYTMCRRSDGWNNLLCCPAGIQWRPPSILHQPEIQVADSWVVLKLRRRLWCRLVPYILAFRPSWLATYKVNHQQRSFLYLDLTIVALQLPFFWHDMGSYCHNQSCVPSSHHLQSMPSPSESRRMEIIKKMKSKS